MSNSYLISLPRPFFVLAPMFDVTDSVFRQVIAKCAPPDLYYTEFVNVDGLQSPGREKLLMRLQFTEAEQPLIAQIWGQNPENYYKTAQQLAAAGFAGIDINMGCPDKSVVKNGTCSALINNRELAAEIIAATKAGAGLLPVSVKTRLGFNQIDFSWHEFLLKQSIAMLAIHGRTRQEMSKVPAHWQAIGDIRQLRDDLAIETLIVGNGDVISRQQGEELAKEHSLDGIMIGRGIFHDPYLFARSSPWPNLRPIERLELFQQHIELFITTWKHDERHVYTLNKFCKIYINGFDGAKEIREQLMHASSPIDLLAQTKALRPIFVRNFADTHISPE